MSLFCKQESLDEFRPYDGHLDVLKPTFAVEAKEDYAFHGQRPNINFVFLPKNTTSKTQPLDSGIIASCKCIYKKRLLRHVCSKVDGSNGASDIVKSVKLLMSIEWGRQAWDDVSRETIVKCFKKTGLYPDEVEEEDDPFERGEVSGLQELVTAMEVSCTAEEFLAAEDEIQICSGLFNSADPKWREKAREGILKNHKSISTEAKQFHVEDSDEEEDQTTKEPAIKSENEALRLSEMLLEYSRYHGQEDLTLAISKATDLLKKMKFKKLKQSRIDDYYC